MSWGWVWREIIWAGNVCGDGIIHPRGNVQEKCTTLVTDSRNERRATEPKTFIYSSVEAKKNNNVITFDRQSEVIRSHWSEWDQYDTKRSAVCIDMRRRMLLRAVFFCCNTAVVCVFQTDDLASGASGSTAPSYCLNLPPNITFAHLQLWNRESRYFVHYSVFLNTDNETVYSTWNDLQRSLNVIGNIIFH